MNQKKTLLILILALVLLIAGAGFVYNGLSQELDMDRLAVNGETVTVPAETESGSTAPAEAPTEPAAQFAPDFTVYDAAGNAFQLSDFRGTPVVLNFWASWCGPCQSEMPDFNEKAAQLAGEVQFLMVNLTDGAQETVETAAAFIAEQGYTFPVFYDTDQAAAYAYGVRSIPTTYFIDAQGHAVAYASGAIDGDLLQQGIDMISE